MNVEEIRAFSNAQTPTAEPLPRFTLTFRNGGGDDFF
jgi:hypothetical protein